MSPPRPLLASLARHFRVIVAQQQAAFTSQPRKAAGLVRHLVPTANEQLQKMDRESDTGLLGGAEQMQQLLYNPRQREERQKGYADKGVRMAGRQNKMNEAKVAGDFQKQAHRNWMTGEVYSPHDLSPEQIRRFTKRAPVTRDVLDFTGINPLDHYQNFSIISEFMTTTGRIRDAASTGLRPVNQRKMAKAIRRAIGLGIHPSVHRHPQLINTPLIVPGEESGYGSMGLAPISAKWNKTKFV